MKYYIIFIVILSIFLVSTGGFYDAKEISETVSVVAMAIDKGENMPLRVSFHIESASGKEEKTEAKESEDQGKTDKKSKDVVTIEAPTILSAYARANSVNSLDLNIDNVKMVIFSKELSEEGLFTTVKELASSTEFKNNSYLTVSKGKAEDVLNNVSPEDEEYLSVYYEKIIFRHFRSATRNFLLSETYFSMIQEDGGDFMLPLVSVRENDGFENSYKDDVNSNLTAGMIPKESKHKIEFLGGAVFSKGKLKGYLTESEMLSAGFIMSFFATRDISVEYPQKSGKFVSLNLEELYESKFDIKTEENMKTKVKLYLKGTYEFITEGDFNTLEKDFPEYLKETIKKDAEEVLKKCIFVYDADIFGIKKEAKKEFLTKKKMDEYKLFEKIKTGEFTVEVNLEMAENGRFSER